MRILFVTWDGPQVSYLEGLFLPIFHRLANYGFTFNVLQFTWGDGQEILRVREACESAGVSYKSVRVWRKPVAAGSLLTAVAGRRAIRRAVYDLAIDVVMPRSTLPSLSTLLALRGRQMPIVLDADGLPVDERVEFGGRASSGLVQRLLRDIEAQAVARADVVLTRSSKAVDILHARAGAGTPLDRFHIVSNGRDAEQFTLANAAMRKAVRGSLGIGEEAPLLVYAGSIGKQYCFSEMMTLFCRVLARRRDARFLILTGSPETVATELLRFPHIESSVIVLTVGPDEVPEYLGSADLGLALRVQCFSMQAVAPIKLGEYLLCGLPVIASAGIGDMPELAHDIGYTVEDMSNADFNAAADWFVESVLPNREANRARCRQVGLEHYSLDVAVDSYCRALEGVRASFQ